MEKLKNLLQSAGADLVGFADLSGVPQAVQLGMTSGVAIGVAIEPGIAASLSLGPSLAYQAEYRRLNRLLDELAALGTKYLKSQGHKAQAVGASGDIDATTLSTPTPHKTVATRAGLGWVGKTALLVTEAFGPALRLSSILTDAAVPAGPPIGESRCGQCTECVTACPAHAASGQPWLPSLARQDFFDAFACLKSIRERMPAVGLENTICGICIGACPWTKRYLAR